MSLPHTRSHIQKCLHVPSRAPAPWLEQIPAAHVGNGRQRQRPIEWVALVVGVAAVPKDWHPRGQTLTHSHTHKNQGTFSSQQREKETRVTVAETTKQREREREPHKRRPLGTITANARAPIAANVKGKEHPGAVAPASKAGAGCLKSSELQAMICDLHAQVCTRIVSVP
jgi:hypothetical protein